MGMWQSDYTLDLSWRATWWWSILYRGIQEADAIFRGQLVIMRMKGRQTILGRCYARRILVLGVYYTQCQLMIMPWRDREGWLNFVFCNDGKVVDNKQRNGGWRWGQCGGYARIWEMRGTTCQIQLGIPDVSVITRPIGTRTCHIGDGKLTRRRHSPSSSFSCWFAPTLQVSLPLMLNSTVT